MIRVENIHLENNNGKTRLSARFHCNGHVDCLWFEMDQHFCRYASVDCGDAFFVILTVMAHACGEDISFEPMVSRRLHFGVTSILMPALAIMYPDKRDIRINCKSTDFNFVPEGSGTAMSRGVDSFHAVAAAANSDYPVSHLTFFNSGSFGLAAENRSEDLFQKAACSAVIAAENLGTPLIVINSNIDDIIGTSFIRTHSIRNLAFVMLLPRLFEKYYYASGYPVTEFRINDTFLDATHFDLLIAKSLGTESLEVLVSGLFSSRIEKIRIISDFLPSYHNLNVCTLDERTRFIHHDGNKVQNCSQCFKCVKTMAALDALGKLDFYASVFDVQSYRARRAYHLGRIVYDAFKLKSVHAKEILAEGQRTFGFLPTLSYAYAITRGAGNLGRKLSSRITRNRTHGGAR